MSMIPRILTLLFFLVLPGCADPQGARDAPADLLLAGGTVYDGTGDDSRIADVAVTGRMITFVGDATGAGVTARDTLDVAGLMVTPGFIDMHSHAELSEEWGKDGLPFIYQGITTAVMGVDGGGSNELTRIFQDWADQGSGLNALRYVGHNAARRAVMGNDDRAPSEDEMEAMKAYVRAGMEEGALGLSSGLFYVPGTYAETEEVIELNRVAAEYGGIYDTHDRDLGAVYGGVGLLASIEEAIQIGEEAGTPVIFSHFNPQGAHNYGEAPEAARLVEAARSRGVEVAAAQHPYTATQSNLRSYTIPDWASAGGHDEMVRRFDHPDTARILDRETMEMLEIRGGAEKIRFADPRPDLSGRTLDQVAEEWDLPVPETVRRILRDGNVAVNNLDLYDDWNTRYLAQQEWMMTCTDGRTPSPDQAQAHPRPYGGFTKKLRDMVLEDDVIDMPFAIRSMSGLAADFLGLQDRGYLQEGMYADIAVFDRDRIRDRATFEEPQLYAEGTVHVLVNGVFALRDAEPTGALAGLPLLRGGEVFPEALERLGMAPRGDRVARSAEGMVVSAKPLATRVDAEVLARGGNAVDAAVASALALTVVEPSMSSIAGRTQILIRTPDGRNVGLDGGTEVVAGFDPAHMPAAPEPTMGYGTVAIPGTVAALARALNEHGTWSWSQALEPAIALAEDGFILTEGQGARWARAAEYLALYPGGAFHFLKADGSPYRAGERFRQPGLADALRTLADEGPEVLYIGRLGEAMVEDLASGGGLLTMEDLADYTVRDVPVGVGSYRGREVVGTHLPASGVTTLQILQVIEAFDQLAPDLAVGSRVGSPEWIHVLAQALRIGFEDRVADLGTPEEHTALQASTDWARERAATIRLGEGEEGEPALAGAAVDEPAHTTHLSVADGRGGVVALTQSIGPAFGSHVAHPEFGLLYASTQGYIGSEPGTRPMSSMSPLVILNEGDPELVVGGAGARRIVSAMVSVISRSIDDGADLEAAMRAPRFHALDDEIRLEVRPGTAWDDEVLDRLRELGDRVSTSDEPSYFARLHSLHFDRERREFTGVADPRRVGAAKGPSLTPVGVAVHD